MRTRNPNAPDECLPPAVIIAGGALLLAWLARRGWHMTRAELAWLLLIVACLVLAYVIGAPGGGL